MNRTLYDSTTAADCPPGGDLYAGYTDGMYRNVDEVRALHPGVPVVSITAVGRVDADIVDAEPGCVWPPAAVVLRVREQRARGGDPGVYVGLANWASVWQAFASMGEPQPRVWWTAHYDNIRHLCSQARCAYWTPPGVTPTATQFGGDRPGHYDISEVGPVWPGVDTGDQAVGTGTPIDTGDAGQGDDDMALTPDGAQQVNDIVINVMRSPEYQAIVREALAGVLISSTSGELSGIGLVPVLGDLYLNARNAALAAQAVAAGVLDPTTGFAARITALQADIAAAPAGQTFTADQVEKVLREALAKLAS